LVIVLTISPVIIFFVRNATQTIQVRKWCFQCYWSNVLLVIKIKIFKPALQNRNKCYEKVKRCNLPRHSLFPTKLNSDGLTCSKVIIALHWLVYNVQN
jgi:hypothetical protein